MDQLLQQIEKYKQEISQFTNGDIKTVEEFRIKWLGTKGIVKNLMGEMKNVSVEKKKEFGQVLNDFKSLVENKFDELKQVTSQQQPVTNNEIDLSLPGNPMPPGSRHPVSLMKNRIVSI